MLLLLLVCFSILYRIDASVTGGQGSRDPGGAGFQYPLSDRCLCNYDECEPEMAVVYRFSILYRIDASVTGWRVGCRFV